jgi:hypothetical protein
MRFWYLLCASLTWLVMAPGCGEEEAPPVEAALTAVSEAALGALPEGAFEEALAARGVERTPLFGDVARYRFRVRVGAAKHDVITLYRVVREEAPGRPARSSRAVFMVHGDGWGFEAAFLSSVGSAHVPVDHSLAAFLAKEGVDVWGIDLRWVGVPGDTADFSFMREWTLGTHVRDVGTGLELARRVRAATGSARGSMHLLGWSRGATVGYAYVGAESQRPRGLRRVDGFIPVDMVVSYGPEDAAQQAQACLRYDVLKQARTEGRLEGGLLGAAPGRTLQLLGQLAAAAPDAPSPLLPEDIFGPGTGRPSNRQATLFAAAATGSLLAPLPPITPGYHLMAGVLDPSGLPSGLAFTRERYVFEYAQRAAPFQSFNEVVETEAWACSGDNVPYDDHLEDVTVPVLYVGAAGGVGRYGEHGLTLLGSQDVTSLVVRTRVEAERALDYGHADLFLADDARERVWTPLLQWVRQH